MDELLALLARPAGPPETTDREGWLAFVDGLDEVGPIDRAIRAGFAADRLGWAFLAGYRAALSRLVPDRRAASLCVTEAGGAHPRGLTTALLLEDNVLRLRGVKQWATGADAGEDLLIAAHHEGRLVLVAVPVEAARLEPMPPTPFVPEIGHFRVHLEGVRVGYEQVLPGDGWGDYVKPFRTVEDLHVSAAAAAMVLRQAHAHGWPRPLREGLLGLLVGFRGLAEADPRASATHLALSGLLGLWSHLLTEADPCWGEDPVGQRWQRDRGLLRVASSARERRREVAWERTEG